MERKVLVLLILPELIPKFLFVHFHVHMIIDISGICKIHLFVDLEFEHLALSYQLVTVCTRASILSCVFQFIISFLQEVVPPNKHLFHVWYDVAKVSDELSAVDPIYLGCIGNHLGRVAVPLAVHHHVLP